MMTMMMMMMMMIIMMMMMMMMKMNRSYDLTEGWVMMISKK